MARPGQIKGKATLARCVKYGYEWVAFCGSRSYRLESRYADIRSRTVVLESGYKCP
jgi:hypothetical protein